MDRYNVCKSPHCKAVHIEGSSLTIPGLAPDLQTLLAAAEQGEPLPRVGTPMFDENEEAGLIRVQVAELPPEELKSRMEEPAPREEPETPGSEEALREVPDEEPKP